MSGVATAIGLSALVGAGTSMYLANEGGDQQVSTTQTTDWKTPSQVVDAQSLWNEFINDFYGMSASSADSAGQEYLRNYPNVADSAKWNLDPWGHYLAHGKGEGKIWPENVDEAAQEYLRQNPDVAASPVYSKYPFEHYTTYGQAEGRIWPEEVSAEESAEKDEIKSYQQRLEEDLTYGKETESDYLAKLEGINADYMGGIQDAVSPYQQQIADTLGQAEAGTGYFKPVSFGFGGQEMASFVPKQNRDLITQLLGIGKEGMTVNAGLVELKNTLDEAAAKRGFDFSAKHTPNEIANAYSAILEELAFKMSTGQSTISTTGTIPGQSDWQSALAGINLGTNVASKYPWGVQDTPTTTTTDDAEGW